MVPQAYLCCISISLPLLSLGCTTWFALGNGRESASPKLGVQSAHDAPSLAEPQGHELSATRKPLVRHDPSFDGIGLKWNKIEESVEVAVADSESLAGYVDSADRWQELWHRLHGKAPPPDVDFNSKWVYVSVKDLTDPNTWRIRFVPKVGHTPHCELMTTALGYSPSDRRLINFYLIEKPTREIFY